MRIERGSMVYTRGAKIKGKMNSEKKGFKGVFASIGRAMTSGESFFVTTVTGTSNDAEVGVAPTVPGKIIELSCHDSQQYYLNTGAFLACDTNMGYKMEAQNVIKAGFSGTGGLFVMRTHGDGTMLANAFGDVLPIKVTSAHPVIIDNEHVVAWDTSLEYNIGVGGDVFGYSTGEGYVDNFFGEGTVYIQTRNLQNLKQVIQVSNNSGDDKASINVSL